MFNVLNVDIALPNEKLCRWRTASFFFICHFCSQYFGYWGIHTHLYIYISIVIHIFRFFRIHNFNIFWIAVYIRKKKEGKHKKNFSFRVRIASKGHHMLVSFKNNLCHLFLILYILWPDQKLWNFNLSYITLKEIVVPVCVRVLITLNCKI